MFTAVIRTHVTLRFTHFALFVDIVSSHLYEAFTVATKEQALQALNRPYEYRHSQLQPQQYRGGEFLLPGVCLLEAAQASGGSTGLRLVFGFHWRGGFREQDGEPSAPVESQMVLYERKEKNNIVTNTIC
ncbi:hypothetical protein NQZ68_005778 [Dissostichus eleginoides]|nr:hypothetical protein NQZ68_005778 [Dissostichus eleginoides]